MTTDPASARTQPEPDEESVRAALRDSFGVEGVLTRLDGEHDLNWRVDSADGTYVARLSGHPGAIEAHEFQAALLAHIHRVDAGIRIPVPLEAHRGGTSADLTIAGRDWRLRLFTFVPGRALRHAGRSPELLRSVGRFMGRLSVAMRGFGHPGAHQANPLWNLDNAGARFELIDFIEPPDVRACVERAAERWRRNVEPVLPSLPAAVVHHDANDDNVLVESRDGEYRIGLVDFGDAVFARRINELAVALAYALMDVRDITAAARAVIGGYTSVHPLMAEELAVLFDLVAARLAMSLCISFKRRIDNPGNAYLQVSQQQAAGLLGRLQALNPQFAACIARAAGGHLAVASREAVVSYLSARSGTFQSVFNFDLHAAPRTLVSLDRNSPGMEHADDPVAYGRWLDERMRETGARYAIGLYAERRDCYTSPQFESETGGQRRSVHLGIDLFVPAGTPVRSPLPGRVLSAQDNDAPLDYGTTIILEHRCGPDGPSFCTLYGHLSRASLRMVSAGMNVEAGQTIGETGTHEENGGWTPHLHFQVITDMLGESGNFHGAGEPDNMDVWEAICPDPNLILGLVPETFEPDLPSPEAL
ncbi:MAG: phosphotransferase, partial [Arenicellales bacterium]